MQEQDLQQIKQIIDESLEEKLESKLEENNRKIFQRMDEMEDRIVTSTKRQFNEHTEALADIKNELHKRANESTVLRWGDDQIIPVKNDVNKLKYLHKDEWKKLPDSGTISRTLVEEGLKT